MRKEEPLLERVRVRDNINNLDLLKRVLKSGVIWSVHNFVLNILELLTLIMVMIY